MKVFVAGIVLACAGTGLVQMAITNRHVQVQAAPSSIPTKPDDTYVYPLVPSDASVSVMNQTMPDKSVDDPPPPTIWDNWDGSKARSAEGWDGTSPNLPGVVTTSKTGSKGATSGTSKSASSTSKVGTAKTGTTAKAPSVAAPKVPQGTKGALAAPQTLSQGPSVKPVKVPVY